MYKSLPYAFLLSSFLKRVVGKESDTDCKHRNKKRNKYKKNIKNTGSVGCEVQSRDSFLK